MGNFEFMSLEPTFTRETLKRLGATFPQPTKKRTISPPAASPEERKQRKAEYLKAWNGNHQEYRRDYRRKWMREFRRKQKLAT